MARVLASERTRNALKDMFAGKSAADKSSLVRQAARLIVEEALEGEAADALGRGYYEHGAERRGYRNGNRPGRVKSAEGEIRIRGAAACRHGAPGLMRAFEEVFPRALRQRCLAHKVRNLQSKVPEEVWREPRARRSPPTKPAARSLRRWQKRTSCRATTATIRAQRSASWTTWTPVSPTCSCQSPTGVQRVPPNILERLFGEERRRTKVIPHAFGERAVLKLMYASLIRASETWKRIVITEFELRQLEHLREHLNECHVERTAPVVKSASRSQVSSKART